MPCGVIDFGDVTRTLRVCELAVAASIALRPRAGRPDLRRRRDRARLRCRLPARRRRAGGAAAPDRRARRDRRRRHRAAGGARAAQRLRPARARGRLGDLRGRGRPCRSRSPRRPSGWPAGAAWRRLAPRVPPGLWPLPGHRAGCRRRPLADRARPASRAPGAIGAHGEARWHATRELSNAEPATIHLGLDVFAPGGQRGARAAGRPRRARRRARARARGRRARRAPGRARARVAVGESVAAGALSGTSRRAASCPRTCTCRSRRARPATALPGLATPGARGGLARALPAPGRAARLAARRSRASRALLARRRAVIPQAQPLYYAAPPEIVRGLRQHLYDAQARAYLDCVNNVAVVGHSHPRVTAAATRQLRLLNTNSRFLYESMTRFAERLAALLPAPLERVFLVSTGSEANDLALRLARAATGRARRALHPRRLPRLDDRDLRGLDELRRQPAGRALAARGRAPGALARHLPRPRSAPASPTRACATPRRCARRSPASLRAGARPRRSSARRSTATPAASSCPTATWRPRTRTCARRAGSASPTRCRSATGAWERTSGASSSRASCPTSSRSRRRPATGTRSPR